MIPKDTPCGQRSGCRKGGTTYQRTSIDRVCACVGVRSDEQRGFDSTQALVASLCDLGTVGSFHLQALEPGAPGCMKQDSEESGILAMQGVGSPQLQVPVATKHLGRHGLSILQYHHQERHNALKVMHFCCISQTPQPKYLVV